MNTIEEDLDGILEHYGVKGMRWGVRRSREELDRAAGRRRKAGKPVTPTKRQQRKAAKAAQKQESEDAKKVAEAAKKIQKGDTSALTNEEMQLVVKRMNLEQQYRELETKKNKATMSEGQKVATDILDMANQQAKQKLASELVNASGKYVAQVLKDSHNRR